MQGREEVQEREPIKWRWMELSGPHQGHLAPIFRVLVVSSLCCLFVMCISPTLVFVPVISVETKYAQKELCRFESQGVQQLFIQI